MKKLTIQSLKCYETEDYTGADECRLEVYVDGSLQAPPFKRSMNDGQTWYLNKSFNFEEKVEVKLWDEDSPDPDDFLGNVQIPKTSNGNVSASFKEDGSNYKLYYKVTSLPDSEPDLVQQSIQNFENSHKPGLWPYISKSDLLIDIRATVANPYKVAQGSTPLCGPASIVFELVSRQPQRYVEICQQLYEVGSFEGRTKTIKPSDALINSRVGKNISLADWMLMASLRDTENILFAMDATAGSIAGITTPWEMKGWSSELLGYNTIEYESLYVYGEFEAMRKASRVRKVGGVAFLMIHSAMLNQSEKAMPYPDHWVSFLGNLSIDEGVWYQHDSGHISFDCYSWGRKYHINVDEGRFEDCIYGIVTAM